MFPFERKQGISEFNRAFVAILEELEYAFTEPLLLAEEIAPLVQVCDHCLIEVIRVGEMIRK